MAIERRLGTFTDGFIFECRYSAERYAQAVGTPAAEWRVIPNGLMANEFAPRVADADASDVLFVGELRHLKGVDILLNALGRINHTRRVGATIVGDGPDAESFKRLARQLGIDAHVRFAGAMPAAAAFKLGHILAMPSRAESFPYIVLEAAAAGIPILATRVGGIPEIVAGTDTQLLPANDVGALVDALEATLARPDVAVAKAERLRTRIGERFTVAGMTDAVLSFYDDCRSRRSKKA